MKYSNVIIVTIILPLFILLASSKLAFAGDPLMDREGRTLKLKIDGAYTISSPARDIKDSGGIPAYTIHWTAPANKSPKCFSLSTHDKRLGTPERIDLIIREIRSDRPHHRWKDYKTEPSTTLSVDQFLTPQGYCIKEFYLTETLRYPSLPAGDYVLMLSYWGVGNWDRQEIFLKVQS